MILDRLQTIISHYGLTPSVLADTIGVPRSSISHLISGRNKPSLDFVLKLVKKYPEVNLYWLLYGEGRFPLKKDDLPPPSNQDPHTNESKHNVERSPRIDQGKSIETIVVLYEDGTFTTYQPKK